ncbi:MAG: endonuclease/exonuclease/phosphatase family protein [Verrucomicrobiales bacterium]|nr:endonuclease/exonuclease/phosphatase family protein [Verrucomicrobiales bacterium]
MVWRWIQVLVLGVLALRAPFVSAGDPEDFRVATFNLENYHLHPFGNRTAKSPESRRQVVEEIVQIHPDVLALQEVGDRGALDELQARLRERGLTLPHVEHVSGWDTNIFVGVLSRFPITARRPHVRESYLLNGRRFFTSRGIAELDIEVSPRYRFTLVTTHLKSRRQSVLADESEMREAESRILRRTVDGILEGSPQANVIVCGDFNDTQDTPTIRTLIGRGRTSLLDSRPGERSNESQRSEGQRTVTWTHHYGKEDTYSRIDYILLSKGMAREWRPEGSYVLATPHWGLASDHRPLVCEFVAKDR